MPCTAASSCVAFSFPEVFCNLPHAVRRRQLSFLPKKSIESVGKMTLFRFAVLKFPVNLPVCGIFCPPFLSGITYKAYWRSARHDLEFQHALCYGGDGGVLRRCAATPHPPPSGAPVSLRVGRSADLTRHRRVIQHREPPRGKAWEVRHSAPRTPRGKA